jgi:acetolactate synthase-1/2/3 large subunit
MNGAQALLQALVKSGIEICFANPGTSEMHLLLAIGKSDAIRPILCLFEGVATGAADGYGRMADKPAITLLHMGPGFANGMANLHNAHKAHVPLINIVGNHAVHHLQYDSPLNSDVPAHARICSDWVHVSESADDLAASGFSAMQASMKGWGKIATIIVPSNHAWEEACIVPSPLPPPPMETILPATIDDMAAMLSNGKRTALILGGRALREDALKAAGRIADTTGVALLCETFPARMQRGAGRVKAVRIPYPVENALELLQHYEQFILAGAQVPVAFFAYPGKPSLLIPEGCNVQTLARIDTCAASALKRLADRLKASSEPIQIQASGAALPLPTGALTPQSIAASINILLPDQAIVSDEGVTSGFGIYVSTENAAPHDWLAITGGAIGQGLPVSLGAAVACPDRKVVALQADGSAMYTVQALWTLARVKADVTVILFNNRSYAILNHELARVGAGQPNDQTLSMLKLSPPDIDWVHIALGMGVRATRCRTADEFHLQFADAMKTKGPSLIEALLMAS